jgi:hypothetical protein
MLPAEFPLYFCGLPFRAHQVRGKLRCLLSAGEIRQVVKGVYVDVRVPDSRELRAAAVALLIPQGSTAAGHTAAWIHGIEPVSLGPSETEPVRLQWGQQADDIVQIAGLSVTSPATTAVELAMHLPRPFALSTIDAMLRTTTVTLPELNAIAAAYERQPGIYQARQILSYADRRAESPGESWLRLRLIDAGFGLPDHQIRVKGPSREYRLDLGYPEIVEDGRRLGLEYDSDRWHSRSKDEHRDEVRRTELDALGRHIISVRRPDLWGSYPALELAVGTFLCQQPRLPRRW